MRTCVFPGRPLGHTKVVLLRTCSLPDGVSNQNIAYLRRNFLYQGFVLNHSFFEPEFPLPVCGLNQDRAHLIRNFIHQVVTRLCVEPKQGSVDKCMPLKRLCFQLPSPGCAEQPVRRNKGKAQSHATTAQPI